MSCDSKNRKDEPIEKPVSKVRRWRRLLLLFVLLLGAGIAALWMTVQAPRLLVKNSPPEIADTMVVLGGESWTRPQRAAELFRQGVAPRVLISGDGDCQDLRRLLENRGVPASAIQIECESCNTKENAEFCAPLLREAGAKRVIIVTSWYHSRRALNSFQKFAPEITFYSCSTRYERKSWWPDSYECRRIWQEYAKLVYYKLRWGI
jgi:uncharacterized SAM-binding protein YcdF (DUF218 family)